MCDYRRFRDLQGLWEAACSWVGEREGGMVDMVSIYYITPASLIWTDMAGVVSAGVGPIDLYCRC